VLTGKKVLVVDVTFATSRDDSILEPYNMQISRLRPVKGAIETLHQTPEMDVVLMDINDAT